MTLPAGEDALGAELARTKAAIETMPVHERWPWHFARCWLLAGRIERPGFTVADLDLALADFDRLPPGAPGRARLAAVLVRAQVLNGVLRDHDRLLTAVELAGVARSDPAPLADWPLNEAVLRAYELMDHARNGGGKIAPREALAELDRLAVVVDGRQPYVVLIELVHLGYRSLRAQTERDYAELDAVVSDADAMAGRFGANPQIAQQAELMSASTRALVSLLRGDEVAAAAALDRIESLRGRLASDNPVRAQLDDIVAQLRPIMDRLAAMPASESARQQPQYQREQRPSAQPAPPGSAPPPGPAAWSGAPEAWTTPPAADLDRLRQLAGQPRLDPAERANRLAALGLAEVTSQPPMLDAAVEDLRAAVEFAPVQDPHRPFYLMTLGGALIARHEHQPVRADLDEAISVLVRARSVIGSPAHPVWALVAQPLAHAYRLAGRNALGRKVALGGLRGHAWSALMQANTAAATNAIRNAAEDALEIARWCLQDGDPAGAATALDAGRGLILFAETERRDIAARLEERGEHDLARRWRAAAGPTGEGKVPAELTEEILGTLAGVPLDAAGAGGAESLRSAGTSARLLDPPGQQEVRAALRAVDADFLVYLVPGDGGTGAAVMVPADAGRPADFLALPALSGLDPAELQGALANVARRDAAGVSDGWHSTGRRLQYTLHELCEWAWQTAIGPLLEHLSHGGPQRPRVVLVPVRELTTVPWHAACRTVAGRVQYAVERAVFSYTPSARLLCDAAAATPVPAGAGGLIVGDPDTGGVERDLPAARAEALAIAQAFYPRARYVGRDAAGRPGRDGRGTPEEVVKWLADPAGGAVLHLACHGVVSPAASSDWTTGETSGLVLEENRRLAAEEIVAALSGGADRAVGLVVLAACNSAVAARGGYDEAFSLATTFLAGGVRTVMGTQWSVPDGATSVLMFMFHHYLREGLAAREALHRAQLWMLDPRRVVPATMPANLRDHLHRTQPDAVASWAGFVHLGR